MENIINNALILLSKPESLLVLGGVILVVAGVFSSINIRENSFSLSNKKSILSFITGFILILLAMTTSWWPLIDRRVNCKELVDIKDIITNVRDMSAIAQRNCRGDYECDKHTMLSYNRSIEAITYIDRTINDIPSVKATCPK